MNFLAPLFLLAALGLALPVLFHLVRRTTRQRLTFSSLLFLQPVPPRLTQRNRIEHLLLLLLRCLALALIILGFARPLLRHTPRSLPSLQSPPRRMLLLLDTSASMRRANLWPLALAEADRLLQQASPADDVALAVFDRSFRSLLSFTEWRSAHPAARLALARERLATQSPTWAAGHLDAALIEAASRIAESPDDVDRTLTREIRVLSDLQDASGLQRLQSFPWPRHVTLVTAPLQPTPTSNAGLELLPESPRDTAPTQNLARLRIRNAPDSHRERLHIAWANAAGPIPNTGFDLHIPAGQSRIVSLPAPAPPTSADRVLLSGDDEPYDNLAFVPPFDPRTSTVLYLGRPRPGASDDPAHFLQLALQSSGRHRVLVHTHPPGAPIPETTWQACALLVLADPVSAGEAEQARKAAARGATCLMLLLEPGMAESLGRILQAPPPAIRDGPTTSPPAIGQVDFNHPAFAPFADPRYSDFSNIRVWRHTRLDASSITPRILARLDDQDPLLFEWPLGNGRILALTAGWQPAESQFALSTKFVPWLFSLLELATRNAELPERLLVGDPLHLPSAPDRTNLSWHLHLPGGTETNLTSPADAASLTTTPGRYQLVRQDARLSFVVNLDPAESRFAPLAREDFERLQVTTRDVPTQPAPSAQPAPMRDADLENHQKLWRWLLLLALAVLIAETILAGWFTRRHPVQGGTPA